MKYVTRPGWPPVTDVYPETKAEHDMLRKAFPELCPFQYITCAGDGGEVFKRLLAATMEDA